MLFYVLTETRGVVMEGYLKKYRIKEDFVPIGDFESRDAAVDFCREHDWSFEEVA